MDLIEYQHSKNDNRHPWEWARFEVIRHFIKKHYISNAQAVVLDVGCGDTFVLNQLQKQMPQAQYYAIDTAFTEDIINEFQQEGISLLDNIDALNQKIDKADLVFLMDVIEHIEDDESFLKNLVSKEYIDDDTLFIITVPAYQSLFSEHDVFLKHFRRYSRKALTNTLENAGFEIIENGYFFSSLLAPRLFSLAKEKLIGKSKSLGLAGWKGSKKQSKLVKDILYLDFKITNLMHRIGLKLPGLSTYAICRKSVS